MKEGEMQVITFDEFIDEITEGRGEEIKRQIREIELNERKHKKKRKRAK
ncbi:MAG: hypothetical protein QME12_09015 [Nanoarchaeota archaeon]|nr:hypothetical protein [Nanoarchaeota archaeon]